jgi:uncharacterized protein with von Willebrand factor type A (vWA) domain
VSTEQLPLIELFSRLRDAGMPLGVDNYQHLINALQSGFGLPDRAALSRLCRTLWVKSREEEQLFAFHFDKLIGREELARPALPASPPVSHEDGTSTAAPLQSVSQPTAASTIDLMVKVEGETQAVQAIQASHADHSDYEQRHFIRMLEYFPVTRRQMKQTWRYFRHRVREGPATELDVAATVNRLARDGVLLEPVLVPRRVNRAELVLLIDQDGSMVPFHALSRRLAETALRGGRFGKTSIYYFHNCPSDYLYRDSAHQTSVTISEALGVLQPERTSVLIFSDGGAARGGLSEARLGLTKTFLATLRRYVRRTVWLNPLPAPRWIGTTAFEVAGLVPMYGVSRRGMDQAIGVLRGRRAPLRRQPK